MTQDQPARPGVHAGIQGRIDAASPSPALDPRRSAHHRLADAVRRLVERLVATDASEDVLRGAATEIETVLERFGESHQSWVYEYAEAANAGEPGAQFDHSPLIGKANPLAPPMMLEAQGDRVVGRVRFGIPYEGPPGCVHGGYVAAMFDELLGAAQSLSGKGGMTGTLSIRYQSPTPLHTDLDLEAHVDRVEGRKIFVVGTCRANDVTTARAEGIFISIDPQRFVHLQEIRAARIAERD